MKEQLSFFTEQISGFSRVEFLSIFISLLYAFAIAEFFSAWGKMLRHRQIITFSIDHLLWSIVLFYMLIVNWYGMWPTLAYIEKGFIYFAILFIPVMIFYFVAIIFFPDLDSETDLIVYYEKNIRLVVGLTATYLVLQVLITIFILGMPVLYLFNITRGIFISFAIFTLIVPKPLFFRILLGYIFLGMIIATVKL